MFKSKKALLREIEELKKELTNNRNYEKGKIEDDYNVFNQLLEQKTTYYESIIFTYNRYKEEKKVNITTEEITEHTEKIIGETMASLSPKYVDYLVDKYFSSLEKMIEVYTQRIFLRLFHLSNEYNTSSVSKRVHRLTNKKEE